MLRTEFGSIGTRDVLTKDDFNALKKLDKPRRTRFMLLRSAVQKDENEIRAFTKLFDEIS